jgi:2'-5' RNA ligase
MNRSSSRRLFVALWPDDAVRAALAAARDRWTWSATARPTPTANLHVTLVFLGPVPADRVPEMIDALPVFFEPFVLRLDQPALWGNGIAALEPRAPCEALTTLQAAIAERTAALGIPPEARRYRPHVTLGRDARASTVPPHDAGIDWPVSEYALVESRGGRYETVAIWRR